MLTELLIELAPSARTTLTASMFNPDFPGMNSSQQVGLSIHRLRDLVEGLPLFMLPGVPENATRVRQLSFLAGRLCGEYLLRRQGLPASLYLGVGGGGEPLWPDEWTGSISHTNDFAFAALVRRQSELDIGIDAEAIFDIVSQKAVLETCATSDERTLISLTANIPLATTILFTAKEAYYKAVYRRVKRVIEFTEVELTSLNTSSGTFKLGPARGNLARSSIVPAMRGKCVVRLGLVMSCILPRDTLSSCTS